MSVRVDGAHVCDGNEEGHELHSYNLPKGKWQANFGYRHFRSFRHFVVRLEQNAENLANGTQESDRAGTNVINHVHQPMVGVTYGLTDRFSLSADLPYFQALRRSPWAGSAPPLPFRMCGPFAAARGRGAGRRSRPPLTASVTSRSPAASGWATRTRATWGTSPSAWGSRCRPATTAPRTTSSSAWPRTGPGSPTAVRSTSPSSRAMAGGAS